MINPGTLTPIPPGVRVDDDGNWVLECATLDEVEAAADHYGRPAVVVGGYLACVQALEGGRVLIRRAPVEAVA